MDATKKRAEKLQAKGKPVDFKDLLRLEPDSGTTNIRNVNSAHWKCWLEKAQEVAGLLRSIRTSHSGAGHWNKGQRRLLVQPRRPPAGQEL